MLILNIKEGIDMNNSVRKITDGAMMLAIIGIYLVLNRQLAGMMEMFLFIIPLPMVFYGAKYGFKDGLVVYVASVILAFILGGITSLFYIASESLLGLIYGANVKKGANSTNLITIAIVVGIFVNLFSTVIFASVFGYDLTADAKMLNDVLNQYMPMDFAISYDYGQLIRIIIILSAVFTGVLEGLISHLLSKFMLIRLRFNVAKIKTVEYIKVPKWTGYVAFILYFVSNYFATRLTDSFMVDIALMVCMLCGIYLYVFGCIATMVLLRKYMPKYRGFAVIIIILGSFMFLSLFVILGFLYITTDMKERILSR